MRRHQRQAELRQRRGFSFLEIVIVVLITAIMVAIAMPRWSGSLQKFRVSNAAARIVADLSLAQSAAYCSSTSKTVTFTVGSSQYVVSGVAPLQRASGTYLVQLNNDLYQSTLSTVWGQTGTQTITFNGFGLPDKGGSIVVVSGNMQKTIVVDSSSGKATVQ